MTAGAAQTMVDIQRVLPGRSAVMIGGGNVGLIVAYQILQTGGSIAAVVEAAPSIGGYRVHLNKLLRAAVPVYTGHTIFAAQDTDCPPWAVGCHCTIRIWQPETICLWQVT